MKYYLSALCPYCQASDIQAYITSLVDERTKDLSDEESNSIDYEKLENDIYDELVKDEFILECSSCHRDNEGDNINDYNRDI